MNKGFFSQEELTITRGDELIKTKVKKPIIFNCTKCGLGNEPKSIKGKGINNILILNETFNGYDEVKKVLSELDYNINDFYYMGAISCNTDKKIESYQIAACRKHVLKAINELKPKVIITLGKAAIDSLTQHKMIGRLSGSSMLDWNGCSIPDQEYHTYICPTWHLSSINKPNKYSGRIDTDIVMLKQFKWQINNAIQISTKPFYIADYKSECFVYTKVNEAIDILNEAKKWSIFAFDYETTGLKPYRKGHEIYSVSLSNGLFSYSFPFFDNEEFKSIWKELLLSKQEKIAHNKKMESTWTKAILGYWPKIKYDTMLMARSIHNGKKVNLKFLVYSKFGIVYEDEVNQFLEADDKEVELYGANAFNRIKQAPLKKLLLYGALDSLFEYKLYDIEKYELDEHTSKGSAFFNSAMNEISKVEYAGVKFNEATAKEEFNTISKMMTDYEIEASKTKEMKLWDKDKKFSFTAPQDIAYILFTKLKLESKNKTATGKNKSDVDSLNLFKKKYPLVNIVLEWRKLKKIRDTYLKGFIRESVNGSIHTTLNLHIADTLRSSSDSPNLQNVPAHDDFAMNTIRKNIVPSRHKRLIEYDYKALEASIIGNVNGDKNWIKYMTDTTSDMHRDMAAKLYLREKSEVNKKERYNAKNGFVFPTIYLSYWKNTAANLWDCEKETKQHLKEEGFKTLDDYREHVKSVEDWFWNEQFPIARDWSSKTVKEYNKKGYVDLVTGFRCYGPMSKNEIVNKQVQGPASHCKLWTLEQVSKQITKRKMSSRIVLEIHDSILIDADPAEESYLDYLLWDYGTQKIREHWDWLIIPLFIEKKITEINGNWANSVEVGLLKGDR